MSAATDLAALAAITDVPVAQATAVIRAADRNTIGQVLQAAAAAAADPTKLRQFSAAGQRRLQTFAQRLASVYNTSAAFPTGLRGLGNHTGAIAVKLGRSPVAGRKAHAGATRFLAGLGSWLSSAFQSITGTSLSSVTGAVLNAIPIVGPLANAIVNPSRPAVSPATPGINNAAPSQSSQLLTSATAPFLAANESAAPQGVQPVRPANIPDDYVPVVWGTWFGSANGQQQIVYRWQPPGITANGVPMTTSPIPQTSSSPTSTAAAGSPGSGVSPWAIAANNSSAQATQPVQAAGLDPKIIMIGLAALAGVALLNRRR